VGGVLAQCRHTSTVAAWRDPPAFAAAAQIVNVAKPGQEPPAWQAPEDMRLFDPALADPATGQAWPASKRRGHFCGARQRRGRGFDTDHVWTFHAWEAHMEFATYK
jgi:hypothetical protein